MKQKELHVLRYLWWFQILKNFSLHILYNNISAFLVLIHCECLVVPQGPCLLSKPVEQVQGLITGYGYITCLDTNILQKSID